MGLTGRRLLRPSRWFRVRVWFGDEVDAFVSEWHEGAKAYWVPVAFALGVFLYYALPREPLFGVVLTVFGLCWWAAIVTATRPLLRLTASAAALLLAGLCAAQLQVMCVQSPVLALPTTATVEGQVERAALRANGRVRLRILVDRFEGQSKWSNELRREDVPHRIDVSARIAKDGEKAAVVGDRVAFKARLFPPQGPVLPGGYDFARQRFLEGVGASGFVYGKVTLLEEEGAARSLSQSPMAMVSQTISHVRRSIADRIEGIFPAEEAAIAIALTVGERSYLSEDVQEALRTSGLAHILAISGLHMMLVSGAAYFASRLLLALIPDLALKWPLKKIAAMIALCVAASYLAISGASVATQRAFIMASIAFLAILLDKPAITMHAVAVAAMGVMVLDPASVTGAGFQMSFCAVIALVAAYRHSRHRQLETLDRKSGHRPGTLVGYFGDILWRGASALALSSLIAGLATAPIAAFHFHRIAPMGLIANLMAMPILSAIVMPLLALLVVSMAFGLDPLLAPFIEPGLAWLMFVAENVAKWSGSGFIGVQSIALQIGCLIGLLVLCLTQTRLRYLGILPMAAGLALSPLAKAPDFIMSEDGRTAALLAEGQGLAFISGRIPDFLASVWLRAHADDPVLRDKLTAEDFVCDSDVCWSQWLNQGSIKDRLPPDPTRPSKQRPADQRLGGPGSEFGSGSKLGSRPGPGPDQVDIYDWSLPIPKDGLLIAVIKKPAGLSPACQQADIVITDFRLRYPCRSAALVADGRLLRSTGALAGYLTKDNAGGQILTLQPTIPNHARPWTRWRHDAQLKDPVPDDTKRPRLGETSN